MVANLCSRNKSLATIQSMTITPGYDDNSPQNVATDYRALGSKLPGWVVPGLLADNEICKATHVPRKLFWLISFYIFFPSVLLRSTWSGIGIALVLYKTSSLLDIDASYVFPRFNVGGCVVFQRLYLVVEMTKLQEILNPLKIVEMPKLLNPLKIVEMIKLQKILNPLKTVVMSISQC